MPEHFLYLILTMSLIRSTCPSFGSASCLDEAACFDEGVFSPPNLNLNIHRFKQYYASILPQRKKQPPKKLLSSELVLERARFSQKKRWWNSTRSGLGSSAAEAPQKKPQLEQRAAPKALAEQQGLHNDHNNLVADRPNSVPRRLPSTCSAQMR